MKKFAKFISTFITAAVVLTIGILCIVANKAENSDTAATAYQSISLVLGIVFIVVASLALLAEGLVSRRISTSAGISAGVLLSVGIFFCVDKNVAGLILSYICEYVPYALLVVGSVIVADALIVLIVSLIGKKKNFVLIVVVEAVIGALAILFGALLLTVDGLKDSKFMILGIILIVYAAFLILTTTYTMVTSREVVVVAKVTEAVSPKNEEIKDAETAENVEASENTENKAE